VKKNVRRSATGDRHSRDDTRTDNRNIVFESTSPKASTQKATKSTTFYSRAACGLQVYSRVVVVGTPLDECIQMLLKCNMELQLIRKHLTFTGRTEYVAVKLIIGGRRTSGSNVSIVLFIVKFY
jgi:hypothetical protein